MTDQEPFISAAGLVKIFKVADLEVVALQGLDLEVGRQEMLALMGPSGSGKSTLLSALGGLDRPSAGRLVVDGHDLLKLNQRELTAYRRARVGFVWQQTARNLLPYLTARENIELLMTLSGTGELTSSRARRARADELLEAVGMAPEANKRTPQLSGGQQQRVAIACALANNPTILLGDEPTGEVDWQTAELILELLRELRRRYGLTIVLVTHDPRVAEQADRVVAIRDGRTSTETVHASLLEGEKGKRGEEETSGLSSSPLLPFSSSPSRSEELVVVDAAGRLQIPGDQRVLAGIGRRARVEVVDGGILIRPGEDERLGNTVNEQADKDDTSSNGLYSAEPLPAPAASNDKRRWSLGRRRSRHG